MSRASARYAARHAKDGKCKRETPPPVLPGPMRPFRDGDTRGGAAGVSGANVAWSRAFPAMFAVQENAIAVCATPHRRRLPAMRNRRHGKNPWRRHARRYGGHLRRKMLPGLALSLPCLQFGETNAAICATPRRRPYTCDAESPLWEESPHRDTRGGAAGVSGAKHRLATRLSRPCLRFKRIPSPFAQRPADGRIPAMRNRRCGKNPWDEKRARRCGGRLRRKCRLATRLSLPCLRFKGIAVAVCATPHRRPYTRDTESPPRSYSRDGGTCGGEKPSVQKNGYSPA